MYPGLTIIQYLFRYGLVLNKRQATIRTNAGLFYWRMCSPPTPLTPPPHPSPPQTPTATPTPTTLLTQVTSAMFRRYLIERYIYQARLSFNASDIIYITIVSDCGCLSYYMEREFWTQLNSILSADKLLKALFVYPNKSTYTSKNGKALFVKGVVELSSINNFAWLWYIQVTWICGIYPWHSPTESGNMFNM